MRVSKFFTTKEAAVDEKGRNSKKQKNRAYLLADFERFASPLYEDICVETSEVHRQTTSERNGRYQQPQTTSETNARYQQRQTTTNDRYQQLETNARYQQLETNARYQQLQTNARNQQAGTTSETNPRYKEVGTATKTNAGHQQARSTSKRNRQGKPDSKPTAVYQQVETAMARSRVARKAFDKTIPKTKTLNIMDFKRPFCPQTSSRTPFLHKNTEPSSTSIKPRRNSSYEALNKRRCSTSICDDFQPKIAQETNECREERREHCKKRRYSSSFVEERAITCRKCDHYEMKRGLNEENSKYKTSSRFNDEEYDKKKAIDKEYVKSGKSWRFSAKKYEKKKVINEEGGKSSRFAIEEYEKKTIHEESVKHRKSSMFLNEEYATKKTTNEESCESSRLTNEEYVKCGQSSRFKHEERDIKNASNEETAANSSSFKRESTEENANTSKLKEPNEEHRKYSRFFQQKTSPVRSKTIANFNPTTPSIILHRLENRKLSNSYAVNTEDYKVIAARKKRLSDEFLKELNEELEYYKTFNVKEEPDDTSSESETEEENVFTEEEDETPKTNETTSSENVIVENEASFSIINGNVENAREVKSCVETCVQDPEKANSNEKFSVKIGSSAQNTLEEENATAKNELEVNCIEKLCVLNPHEANEKLLKVNSNERIVTNGNEELTLQKQHEAKLGEKNGLQQNTKDINELETNGNEELTLQKQHEANENGLQLNISEITELNKSNANETNSSEKCCFKSEQKATGDEQTELFTAENSIKTFTFPHDYDQTLNKTEIQPLYEETAILRGFNVAESSETIEENIRDQTIVKPIKTFGKEAIAGDFTDRMEKELTKNEERSSKARLMDRKHDSKKCEGGFSKERLQSRRNDSVKFEGGLGDERFQCTKNGSTKCEGSFSKERLQRLKNAPKKFDGSLNDGDLQRIKNDPTKFDGSLREEDLQRTKSEIKTGLIDEKLPRIQNESSKINARLSDGKLRRMKNDSTQFEGGLSDEELPRMQNETSKIKTRLSGEKFRCMENESSEITAGLNEEKLRRIKNDSEKFEGGLSDEELVRIKNESLKIKAGISDEELMRIKKESLKIKAGITGEELVRIKNESLKIKAGITGEELVRIKNESLKINAGITGEELVRIKNESLKFEADLSTQELRCIKIEAAKFEGGLSDEELRCIKNASLKIEGGFNEKRLLRVKLERIDATLGIKDSASVKIETKREIVEYKPPLLRKPNWIPPKSPHNLIEESLYDDPWALLAATIFLNKTPCHKAHPHLRRFLRDHPTPESVLEHPPAKLETYFGSIGLVKRSVQVWRMSHDFVHKRWTDVQQLHGIGKYGSDAFQMFCLGNMEIEPSDRYLRIYQAWYKMYAKKENCT